MNSSAQRESNAMLISSIGLKFSSITSMSALVYALLLHNPWSSPFSFLVVVVNIIWWMVMFAAIGVGGFTFVWSTRRFVLSLFLATIFGVFFVVPYQYWHFSGSGHVHHRRQTSGLLSSTAQNPHLPDSAGRGQHRRSVSDLHQKHLGRRMWLHPDHSLHVPLPPLHLRLAHRRWEKMTKSLYLYQD